MKRDRRLTALSSDHHHALALALRAIRVADGSLSIPCDLMWAEVIAAYDRDLKRHFEIEERLMMPALESIGAQALVDRTREDHQRIRQCLADTGTEVTGRLRSFAGLIRKHVRFEEEELFEAAQQKFPGSVLDEISEASRRE